LILRIRLPRRFARSNSEQPWIRGYAPTAAPSADTLQGRRMLATICIPSGCGHWPGSARPTKCNSSPSTSPPYPTTGAARPWAWPRRDCSPCKASDCSPAGRWPKCGLSSPPSQPPAQQDCSSPPASPSTGRAATTRQTCSRPPPHNTHPLRPPSCACAAHLLVPLVVVLSWCRSDLPVAHVLLTSSSRWLWCCPGAAQTSQLRMCCSLLVTHRGRCITHR